MADLSPATQAVLDAFRTSHTGQGCLAAALRAAADQVVPEPDYWDEDNMSQQGLLLLRLIRAQLLAIAAELRGTNTTPTETDGQA